MTHHRFSVAPMMDWTDRHCRAFHRVLTRRTLLFTEMVTTGAILHGGAERFLAFSPMEHPVAVQLGGSDPADLADCARIAAEFGYDEVNLNVGCPSDRVQSGRFGACLMAEPDLVAECVAAMREAARRDGQSVPVTVKCRIGIDDRDSYEDLVHFVGTVAAAGCRTVTIHARKAWLKGLSPKENREIPPLSYPTVHRLKADFPDLQIMLNGGLLTLEQGLAESRGLDGMMIGRAAYQDPWILARADTLVFGAPADPVSRRSEAVRAFLPEVEARVASGVKVSNITRHMLGLFNGVRGARAWRRHLSTEAVRASAGPEVLLSALALVEAAEDEAMAA